MAVEHKPLCKINQACLVDHHGAPCPGPYGICDCGAERPMNYQQKCTCLENPQFGLPQHAKDCPLFQPMNRQQEQDWEKEYQRNIWDAANEWELHKPRTARLLHDLIQIATLPFIRANFIPKAELREAMKKLKQAYTISQTATNVLQDLSDHLGL